MKKKWYLKQNKTGKAQNIISEIMVKMYGVLWVISSILNH